MSVWLSAALFTGGLWCNHDLQSIQHQKTPITKFLLEEISRPLVVTNIYVLLGLWSMCKGRSAHLMVPPSQSPAELVCLLGVYQETYIYVYIYIYIYIDMSRTIIPAQTKRAHLVARPVSDQCPQR